MTTMMTATAGLLNSTMLSVMFDNTTTGPFDDAGAIFNNSSDGSTTLMNSSLYGNTSVSTTAAAISVTRFIPWDNPKNIISKEAADAITNSFQCYVFPILTVFGIVGNICSLIVLFQKSLRRSTTSIVLIGLAFSDMFFLATNMVRKSECIVARFDELAADVLSATTFYYMHYLKTAFSRTSTLLIVLISVERVIAVAFPLKAKVLVTKTRMIIGVVFCYVLTFACLAGYPPQYTYVYYGEKPFIAYTDFYYDNEESLKIYNEYFLPIGFRHIPVALVFVLNVVIIVLLKRSKKFQKNASATDQKRKDEQKKITRMLLTVAIVYLIALLPGDIFLRCAIEIKEFQFFKTYHNLFLALSDICLLFEMINSCINFVIYMVLNKNFYQEYVRLFCCCVPVIRSRLTSGSSRTGTTRTKSTNVSNAGNKSKEVYVVEAPSGDIPNEKISQVNEAFEEIP